MTSPEPQGQYPQYPQYPQQQYGQPQYGHPQYGQPQYGQPQYGQGYPPPQQQPGNGLAIAGLVCGIIGLLPFLWFVLAPLAVIFGGVGLSKANKGAKYRGQAIAGIIMGVLAIVGYVVIIVLFWDDSRFYG